MLSKKLRIFLENIFSQIDLTELSLPDAEKISKQTQISIRSVEYFALEKGIWPCRYQRNRGILGIEGQQSVLKSKAVVVGLGGLGGHVAEQLSRLGIGEIVGVDPEIFDETNLNRQIFSNEENLGQKKAGEAEKRLKMINKGVKLKCCAVKFGELPDDLWKNVNIVFDCLDNIGDRLALAEKCSEENVPLVHGAIAGWYCQVGVVWPGAKMLEKIYRRQGIGLEKSIGTPVFTAAFAASLMVTQGIKILAGKGTKQKSELFFYDLCNNEINSIS